MFRIFLRLIDRRQRFHLFRVFGLKSDRSLDHQNSRRCGNSQWNTRVVAQGMRFFWGTKDQSVFFWDTKCFFWVQNDFSGYKNLFLHLNTHVCIWPCEYREIKVETDFGQTDFGHRYPTDFGQTDFGQSDFGQSDFGQNRLWPKLRF